MSERERILSAALLWLRNHYECDFDDMDKEAVLDRIDRILKDGEPGSADMKLMREYYP